MYAFDIYSGVDPCCVRFDHSQIRFVRSRFPVLGEQESVLELHCSCCMPEQTCDVMGECDSCHIWYHRHCMDVPSEVFDEVAEVHWECKMCVQSPSITAELALSENRLYWSFLVLAMCA